MKNQLLAILFIFITSVSFGQINGNGNIVSERFNYDEINELLININGEVFVDASAEENYIEITADENLIPFLKPEYDEGQVELTQKKWVESRYEYTYKIGVTNLQRINNDSWSELTVTNLDQDAFHYQSLVGAKSTISGEVEEFRLGAESGKIDASGLKAKNASVNIWGSATAKVNVVYELYSSVQDDGKLIYVNEPAKVIKKTRNDGEVLSVEEFESKPKNDTRYIKFKIKSKGTEVIQAYVKGPKPGGGYFSYGLPIRPFSPRKENWTIGTKLYSVNKVGIRKLIYTVKAEDEGKVVIVSKK